MAVRRTLAVSEWTLVAGVIAVLLIVVIRPKSPAFTRNAAVGCMVLTAVATTVTSYWQTKRRRRLIFGGRDSLNPEDLFSRYYGGSGLAKDVVQRLWADCANALKIPGDKLRPDDKLDGELGPADFWASLDDPREDLGRYAMAHAKRFKSAIDVKGTKTVGELVRRMAEIEMGHSGAHAS